MSPWLLLTNSFWNLFWLLKPTGTKQAASDEAFSLAGWRCDLHRFYQVWQVPSKRQGLKMSQVQGLTSSEANEYCGMTVFSLKSTFFFSHWCRTSDSVFPFFLIKGSPSWVCWVSLYAVSSFLLKCRRTHITAFPPLTGCGLDEKVAIPGIVWRIWLNISS